MKFGGWGWGCGGAFDNKFDPMNMLKKGKRKEERETQFLKLHSVLLRNPSSVKIFEVQVTANNFSGRTSLIVNRAFEAHSTSRLAPSSTAALPPPTPSTKLSKRPIPESNGTHKP
ncbi:hypothetical protein L1987_28485 [Smallanthus sonchifolius]|uniref:Uncharacterized protein n=1 Tax=Smallanthus sonchifolius TaxID=185202 RepID=A0ACB9HYS7_9ASTR|nr:hypothetical protein L1987_28485 [Smallanthus sonchifolius]